MRILITSYVFFPIIGGIPTSTDLLARELKKAGHEVRVVTYSKEDHATASDENVIRNPSPLSLISQVVWCEVLLNVHLSVRLSWPLLFLRRPWVVAHHSWLTNMAGNVGWVERIKRWLLRFATCISVSQATADDIEAESVVIGPPYDDELFHIVPSIPRDQDLLFVGRLVSSKGVDILLDALSKLRLLGCQPILTIVGSGPELPRVQEQVKELQLESQVKFDGPRFGEELRDAFCRHRILVVPSITPETFGLVAIEAISCGCVVVGSDRAGGLKEAIGPCGVTFPLGDANALAVTLADLLNRPETWGQYREQAATHTAQFTAQRVTDEYLKVIHQAMERQSG